MHMADALLSPAVALAFYGASGALLALSARKVVKEPDYERKLPLMGVLGAFVFAGQMVNFSIPGTGSSGHIGGGLLLAALLGPWAAFLVISSVLLIQCLFFADGGLMALGCNLFNLGFWAPFVGLLFFRRLAGSGESAWRVLVASIIAVVISLELGAFSVVIQTLLSGRSELPFSKFCAIMLGIHAPIAVIEGMLTAGVIQFVTRRMPQHLNEPSTPRSMAAGVSALLGCALFLGLVASWFASTRPDGLEWAIGRVSGGNERPAAKDGLAVQFQNAQDKTVLLPNYSFPADKAPAEPTPEPWPAISAGTSVSGLVGALMTAMLIALLGGALWLFRRRQPEAHSA